MKRRALGLVRIALLLGSLILVLGVSLVSFHAVGSILRGVLLAAVFIAGFKTLQYLRRRRGFFSFVGPAGLYLLAIIGLGSLVFYIGGPCAMSPCLIKFPPVRDHAITIRPVDFQAGVWTVEERMIYKGADNESPLSVPVHLPARLVHGKRSGFFLRSVQVLGPAGRRVLVSLPKGRTVDDWICGYFCSSISVELADFPPQAFHAARARERPAVPGHPGPVTIRWELPSFYAGRPEDVEFWYYPSESRLLVLFLSPFAGMVSLGGLMLTACGLVISLVVVPFVFPAIQEIVKERLKKRITGSTEKE
jgi:hypothetical protein